MAVKFTIEYPEFKLKDKTSLKTWIKNVISDHHKIIGNIQYIFVSEAFLLDLNIKYLNHNTHTDIITFNYNDKHKINADIYISIDRVAENAFLFKHEFREELHRVIIHGILHLCGYNDKSTKEKNQMRELENKYLSTRSF